MVAIKRSEAIVAIQWFFGYTKLKALQFFRKADHDTLWSIVENYRTGCFIRE